MDISSSFSSASSKWVERFGRIGLTAKGVVYCITGLLAFMAAFEFRQTTSTDASKEGIFKVIANQPFGKVFIGLIAFGLIFFCVWRFIEAIKDTEHKGSDIKGLGKRGAYLMSGLMYSTMVVYAINFLMDTQKNDNGKKQDQVLQEILNKPQGHYIIIAFALIIVGMGIYQLYFALSGKYKKHVQQSNLQPKTKKLLLRAGKLGYISRGVVWLIIGWLFIKAAIHHNAKEAGGNDNAFQWLETSPYGSFLLGAVALGLICYGVFMFVRAKFQPINSR